MVIGHRFTDDQVRRTHDPRRTTREAWSRTVGSDAIPTIPPIGVEWNVSHTVLICDDAIFMRTMVGDILQQAGFEIVGEAETGVQAVEKYQQLRPDLVTMDIVMPDMGGIDAVREITKFDPQAKVLMCSAMGQQALVVEAIQAGAKDFVVKPFQPSRVLEAVQRVLG